MGSYDITPDPAAPSFSSTVHEPPLQEVTQPVWSERKSILGEWVVALGLALVAALIIRAFFFEAFRIPSESMEDTLLVGDFVLVSKIHYGPRVPVTMGVPFTNMYLENIRLPRLRFPGFSEIKQNDVIVFNVPSEPYPVDRKTHYIKRVVALSGDSLEIVNKVPRVNGVSEQSRDEMKQMWLAYSHKGKDFPVQRLKEQGIYQVIQPQRLGDPIKFEASQSVARDVGTWEEVLRIQPVVRNASFRSRVFPDGRRFSLDNYGPVYVPKKGDTIKLNDETWDLYRDIILQYERNDALNLGDNMFRINGELVEDYIIKQDYFFVMGDNRDSSLDSRTWGFVPKDHVVGKALLVYFSWDSNNNEARTDRILKKIR